MKFKAEMYISTRWAMIAATLACAVCLSSAMHAVSEAAVGENAASLSCGEPGGMEASQVPTSLPDCRAYELVTPPYKSGQPVFGAGVINEQPPMSADGEHLLGVDFAGVAETENEEQNLFEDGAIYEFSRTPNGWTTESLDPPASLFPRRRFVTASADVSRSLWAVLVGDSPGEEVSLPEEDNETLVIREAGAGGAASFATVGPVVSPAHEANPSPAGGLQGGFEFLAASKDLSRVVLKVESQLKQLWPGDTTKEISQSFEEGVNSLYEYVSGAGQEPALVGVKNHGTLKGAPHVNEGAELESECGTILGSGGPPINQTGEGTKYNAMSASGAVVYFTALHREGCTGHQPAANELFARVNGAETVSVSEPVLTPLRESECTGVCREDESEERKRSPATFEGASEDGSKVFFTTSQPLLNSDEDSAPDLYEEEIREGTSPRLVQVSHDPNKGQTADVVATARISEDGSHVYYVAKGVLTTVASQTGEKPEQGAYNLYSYDAAKGATSFVAGLASSTEVESLSATELLQRTGIAPADRRRPFESTARGQFLLFMSDRQLTGSEDTSTVGQLFLYNAEDGSLVRVAIGQCPSPGRRCVPSERFGDNGNATTAENAPRLVPTADYDIHAFPTDAASRLSLAVDGKVVFDSRDALTPQATLGRENVYEFTEGEVYLISSGGESAPLRLQAANLRLLGVDTSGRDVFFRTTNSLVPQDTDTQADWYDAREGGGFATPARPIVCAGETCQGSPSPPLFLQPTIGTSAQTAGENVATTPTAAGNGQRLKPPTKRPTRAEELARALTVCKRKPKRQRASCAVRARRKYARPRSAGSARRVRP